MSSSGGGSAATQGHQEYIQKINPILESLVTQMLMDRPEDPVAFMVKWLTEYHMNNGGGVSRPAPVVVKPVAAAPPPTAAPSVDLRELDGLRKEIFELKKVIEQLEARSSTAPPALSSSSAPMGLAHLTIPPSPLAAALVAQVNGLPSSPTGATEEDSEIEDDNNSSPTAAALTLEQQAKYLKRGPRSSVSAEPTNEMMKRRGSFQAPVHFKTDEQRKRIKAVLEPSFLFSTLAEREINVVVDAMVEVVIAEPDTKIIQQGDDGDVLFIIEDGICECFKKIDGVEKLVKTCIVGDAFGELALLYNCPRAASVIAKTKCVLWQLDRDTFNYIVRDAAMKKREAHDTFLRSVPILESMEPYERSKIADALKSENFKTDEVILKQGDVGNTFYLVASGQCIATKSYVPGQVPKEVMQYKVGDYFGELALLKNEPRAANVIAKTDVTVLSLDRKSFKRLLGPIQAILTRNTVRYD